MTGINRNNKKLKHRCAAIWTILNLMSYLKIYLQIAAMSGNKHIGYFYRKKKTSWLTQYWSLDKIEQGLPCGVVVWKIVSLAQLPWMKLPVTVRNVTVHLWSMRKIDIETCVWGKQKEKVNYLRLIWKLWKPLKGSSVNQHLPSAPHDWDKQKG